MNIIRGIYPMGALVDFNGKLGKYKLDGKSKYKVLQAIYGQPAKQDPDNASLVCLLDAPTLVFTVVPNKSIKLSSNQLVEDFQNRKNIIQNEFFNRVDKGLH